jgi:Holliday junction DNA helicase RuvB
LNFDELIGNEDVKLQLRIASKAALLNNTSIPHIVFAGAPGCGKTSMSKALAEMIGHDFLKVPAEGLKSTKDVMEVMDQLCFDGYDKYGNVTGRTRPSIIFFDEVHNMPLKGQEVLGIAMEEWYVATKNNYTGVVSNVWMPRFTIIGATTLLGKLSKPFRDRFKMTFYFETYSEEEIFLVVKKHAELSGIHISDGAIKSIASRSRGTPRIAVSLLERARDAATVAESEEVSADLAEAVFRIMGIDRSGLMKNDIKILKALFDNGAPIGIDTLSILVNEQTSSVESNIEPFLIQRGLILRTGKGRLITQRGIEYLQENGIVEAQKGRRL